MINDDWLADAVISEYLTFTRALVRNYTALNTNIWSRSIPEIFLLRANALNAWNLSAIIDLREQGYAFVRLDKAQADPAYSRPPALATEHGPMWSYRWARDKRIRVDGMREPEPPDWIMDLARR